MKNRPDNPLGRRLERGKGRGGHRPKLGRFFAHGDLRFLILKLIAEKPRHGYEIIKAIEEQVAGAYSPSPGVIYPTLTLLEELDWIRAIASDGSKRQFEITSVGSLALEANRTTVEGILARMAEVSEAHAGDAAPDPNLPGDSAMQPELRLALDDLKRAIEDRLAGEALTKDQVGAVLAALSTAVVEIGQA
jgi:DNA-binding PadR family transcriptional regulator